MRAKITDVAQLAGVSASTVSHVINKTRFVSEDTTRRVLDAVEELGYTPDVSAQVFKTGRKMMIGFLVPDITNPVFSLLIECVENIVSQQGYRLVVANTRDSVELERNAIKSLASGVVDGLIVASSAREIADIDDCIPASFPVIFVDRQLENYAQDSIVLDCYDAVGAMLDDLIASGHEKIGFIAGIPHLSATRHRVGAYKDAFSRNGLKCDARLIRYLERSKDNADTAITALLDYGCTALIGTNTNITLEVLNCLESDNVLELPRIQVCGFSDSYLAARFEKKLPVIDEPMEQMGVRAGEMILAKIAQPDSVFPVEKLACGYRANHKAV